MEPLHVRLERLQSIAGEKQAELATAKETTVDFRWGGVATGATCVDALPVRYTEYMLTYRAGRCARARVCVRARYLSVL